MKSNIVSWFPLILLLFHAIGFVLFAFGPEAAGLSWLNILIAGALVFVAENNWRKTAVIFGVLFLLGYIIELIGTQTGLLFGNYTYGDALGWKVWGVPLVIGVNWFAIVVAAANISRYVPVPKAFQAGVAAAAAVLLDILIEPVAMQYDFWSWKDDRVPIVNYICWFVAAKLFSYFYLKLSNVRNQTALALFGIWVLFFALLNVI
jgi:bisanhydrobacterioruberin hydratase